ncbi:hypothetical protein BAY61_23360 [Prauserella marina]|uniref:Uncharacterized protein n=1 Tax=Prauserella marina TaxID=530584 RepID=A0A222VUQ5_9PSEU|nr:hypothetical protein [Prauserella marina]ASR37451.1 hypothetical protein BAY61_23360 [Prauserella marina]PWV74660.1 hypothetical protein DES30_10758 [Prauserella marina]SDD44036.1 hypothetical protein SAMN05421630_108193 [Prauserella marina]
MRTLAVLAAIAVLVACWAGWNWWSAADDDGLAVAREREAVVDDISAALLTLHTIDYRDAEVNVDGWIEATTGQLGKDLEKDRQLQLDRAAGTETVATAELSRIAVTELDVSEGSATMLAVLTVHLATSDQKPSDSRSRLTVRAQRTAEGWKVAGVQAADS